MPKEILSSLDFTGKTVGEGPIVVGVCGDVTTSQIAACFAADPQYDTDPDGSEDSQFPVLPLYYITKNQAGIDFANQSLNLRESKWPGWMIREATAFSWFAFNLGAVALTDGTIITVFNQIIGEWIRG